MTPKEAAPHSKNFGCILRLLGVEHCILYPQTSFHLTLHRLVLSGIGELGVVMYKIVFRSFIAITVTTSASFSFRAVSYCCMPLCVSDGKKKS